MTYSVDGINLDGFSDLVPIVDSVQGFQIGGLKEFLDNQ